MVHFHGGGWIQSSIDTHDRLAREYAAAGDVAVVSVDFALSPEARFPQAVEECAAVVRYLSDNGSAWNVDGSRILLGGDSAGRQSRPDHRAAVARQRRAGSAGIQASYPVCDARLDTPSYQSYGAGGYGLTLEQMSAVWRWYVPHEADRMHPLAAPLRAYLTGLPPVLMVLAEMDVLRSEGEALIAKLLTAGVPVDTETFSGVCHGFCEPAEPCRRHATR